MAKKKVYTREETCEMLGISTVTFTAWVRKGLLKNTTKRGPMHITEQSINAILDNGRDVVELANSLEEERKELEARRVRLNNEISYQKTREAEQELRDFLAKEASSLSRYTKKAVDELLPYTTLNEREKAVLKALFNGGTLESVSEEITMTRERTRQIAEKSIRRLAAIPRAIERQGNKLRELEKENAELKAENLRLSEGILSNKQHRTNRPETVRLPKRFGNIYELIRLKRDKHINLLPVRALHSLPALDIDNVYQIIWLSKRDVLTARNMGKKSLSELDDMLEKYGLDFDSDSIDPLLNVNPIRGEEYFEILTAQLEADMIETWKKFRKYGELNSYKARIL